MLAKFGDNGYNAMMSTNNPKAKENLKKAYLPYYQKAIQIGKGKFGIDEIEKGTSLTHQESFKKASLHAMQIVVSELNNFMDFGISYLRLLQFQLDEIDC